MTMAGVARALISSTPLQCSSARQSSSWASTCSTSAASSPVVANLVSLPRKCAPHPHAALTCPHLGLGIRLSHVPRHARGPSSRAPLCARSGAVDESEAVVAEAVPHFLLRDLGVGVFSAGSLVLGSAAGAALAETFEVPSPASGSEGAPTDLLLSVLFIAAFIGLSVVTIGVIYLGVTEFLENRQRVAMQKAGEEKIEKRDRRDVVKLGSGKGFGVRKTEKKTEKGE